ncbi:uncharacterized protein CcaverHIS019_0506130 [Cutaneotrichosporon cavernicola]|uniref:PQ-loop-domain-containing protein n=1 Tax=Cutaneotrichosporon cavernicola TaxID=279322 RepID=A0AA48QX38_9TREE|nr:uncharacterized protein CcaverHIS019_0506130 [Cutaneotrichosporon cavernicola]BEI92985.1 hypothetical protein CcaverHIS019_0506130 [Cutaneotrichosporon cavernicola]BEJ00761.1 hypothetical protein CcaverHIS631_0506180 [Cutaneotrichosporon cavernicola]
MGIIGTLASIGMAVGPPLVYVDQAASIIRKRDSSGFSKDVCGVVIIANIIRVFFWLGERFELALLVQSVLLIISQLALLWICLYYTPLPAPGIAIGDEEEADELLDHEEEEIKPSRPFNFWQWPRLGSYLEFLAGLIVLLTITHVILGRFKWYIGTLGFVALSIESTLPIPQFLSNYRRKSCYGFRSSTLAGWLFGDMFKTGYYFVRNNPLQFKVTGILTICWDLAVLAQRIYYGAAPPHKVVLEQEEEEM